MNPYIAAVITFLFITLFFWVGGFDFNRGLIAAMWLWSATGFAIAAFMLAGTNK